MTTRQPKEMQWKRGHVPAIPSSSRLCSNPSFVQLYLAITACRALIKVLGALKMNEVEPEDDPPLTWTELGTTRSGNFNAKVARGIARITSMKHVQMRRHAVITLVLRYKTPFARRLSRQQPWKTERLFGLGKPICPRSRHTTFHGETIDRNTKYDYEGQRLCRR
jgi:hypothetical protein